MAAGRGLEKGVAVKCLSDKLIVYSLPGENEGETLCLTAVYQPISRHGALDGGGRSEGRRPEEAGWEKAGWEEAGWEEAGCEKVGGEKA